MKGQVQPRRSEEDVGGKATGHVSASDVHVTGNTHGDPAHTRCCFGATVSTPPFCYFKGLTPNPTLQVVQRPQVENHCPVCTCLGQHQQLPKNQTCAASSNCSPGDTELHHMPSPQHGSSASNLFRPVLCAGLSLSSQGCGSLLHAVHFVGVGDSRSLFGCCSSSL